MARKKQAGSGYTDRTATEKGGVYKQAGRLAKCCLVYPNTYHSGMSNLGFQTVYRNANLADGVSCERAFLPDHKNGGKRIQSVETRTDLRNFDIVLFSVSFENDFIHLASLLQDAGIPLRFSQRDQSHPLIIAGGVACFLNPEPIAPFIDCFLLGEAEPFLSRFFEIYAAAANREECLRSLSEHPGCAYVPRFYTLAEENPNGIRAPLPIDESVPRKIRLQPADLAELSTTTCILTRDTAFSNTFLIESGRGCRFGCRFCSAGFIYRPPRRYPDSTVTHAMETASGHTDKIGLVSPSVSDHPDIDKFFVKAAENDLTLSFSSFRADTLKPHIIEKLGKTKVKTATIAPEAGSQRMRDIINKNITEEQIVNCVSQLVQAGIMNLKLYMMVGLPFETESDVHAIGTLVSRIRQTFLETSRKKGKIGTITLSVNPFIPKPATPFQWCGFLEEDRLRKRMKIIREGLKKTPNLQVNFESLKTAKRNCLLSKGDRRTADIIEQVLCQGWAKTMKDWSGYVRRIVHERWDPKEAVPWDIVDTGLDKAFLVKEYRKAGRGKTSPPCPEIDCTRCGICRSFTATSRNPSENG
ncbi:MAG: radical SAM protein [Desulfarculaceae bacterium]|nr:radical SAM protein [Desulfarculaceae bacterium]